MKISFLVIINYMLLNHTNTESFFGLQIVTCIDLTTDMVYVYGLS